MKMHHRNMRFRPPRRIYEDEAGSFDLYIRFFREYLWPFRRPLFFCIGWAMLSACIPYLMAGYGRVVVDSILVVSPREAAVRADPQDRSAQADRESILRHRPDRGFDRRMDRGDAAPGRPPGATQRLLWMFLIYLGTVLAANGVTRYETRVRVRIGQDLTGKLRENLHEKVLRLSLSYHRAHAPGRLMARILSDVGEVQDQMIQTILTIISNTVSIGLGFGIILFIDWRMAAIAASTLPFYIYFVRRTRVMRQEIHAEIRHTNSWMYGLVTQKLDAIRAIQSYGREAHEKLNFHRLSACFLRDSMLQQHIGAGLGRVAGIVSALGTGALFLFGTREVLEGRMTLGSMMYAYAAASNLFAPILSISQINMTLSKLLVILQRLRQIMDRPEEISDAPDAVPFPAPLREGITLRHVHFRYPKTADPVIEDLLLHIPVGNWLCIMGPSGTGKTTLLYLLSRLIVPDSGEILYDAATLEKIRMKSLRKAIALVPQEPQIFSGTIRENICYGYPFASPKQIVEAARAAELHDFIMQLPVQYETVIGEKGTSLSGGQRQRLSLARALLTQPEVLLLDDCTSALDADTEQKIQNTLARILKGRTAVIVSQRVSMARRCHRICVLNNGMMEESGTHDELAAQKGFYGRLVAQQTENRKNP
ncbi:MAG: ABC transporter ATP-binding protein [Kiritimatiellia bacterium]|nr:ABC transporter ATP-binding protein [Kiritimatiellia bacterium]